LNIDPVTQRTRDSMCPTRATKFWKSLISYGSQLKSIGMVSPVNGFELTNRFVIILG